MLAAAQQVNWYGVTVIITSIILAVVAVGRWVQVLFERAEKTRKKTLKKQAARRDRHVRSIIGEDVPKIVHDVLAEHMGTEEKTISSINDRLIAVEAMLGKLVTDGLRTGTNG